MRRIKIKEKVKEWIVGGAFLWVLFWAMAVDSPESAGLLAGGLALLGALVLGVMILVEIRKDEIFSGKKQGFNDTRGTMFFEVARATEQIKPRFLFLENVKGLLSHESGRTFAVILGTLDELGYDAQWRVLNSKDFGVPQNRERVFLIGYLRGTCSGEIFSFGNGGKTSTRERKTTNTITARYRNALGSGSYIIENRKKIIQVGNISPRKEAFGGNPQAGRLYCADGMSPCLNGMNGGKVIPYIIQKARGFNKGGKKEIAPTLTINDFPNNNLLSDMVGAIRRLTPRECWRLQGFPDWAFDRAKAAGVSDTQLYKQAGNSVTVPVIYWIARRLK